MSKSLIRVCHKKTAENNIRSVKYTEKNYVDQWREGERTNILKKVDILSKPRSDEKDECYDNT